MRVIIIHTRHSSSVANSNVHGEPGNENKNDATENRWLGVRWFCTRNIEQVVPAV
jgi:hypothetical protein